MEYYIKLQINFKYSWNVFNNGIYATFVYIQQIWNGQMTGTHKNDCIVGDLMQFGKYTLKSDKLEYLRIKHE